MYTFLEHVFEVLFLHIGCVVMTNNGLELGCFHSLLQKSNSILSN